MFFQFLVIKTLEQDWIRIGSLSNEYGSETQKSRPQAFTRSTRPCFVLLWPLKALTSTVLFRAIFCVNFFLHVEFRLESGSNMLNTNADPQKVTTNPDPQHIRGNWGSVGGGEG